MLKLVGCDFEKTRNNGEIVLNESVKFHDKRIPGMACRFKAKDVSILKQDSFSVGVKYKYLVDKELPVKVIPE